MADAAQPPVEAANRSNDGQGVLSALRLGWYLAELRGRNRPDAPAGVGPHAAAAIPRSAHALPLRGERSLAELEFEVEVIVEELAGTLGVGLHPKNATTGLPVAETWAARVRRLAKTLAGQREKGDPAATKTWGRLANALYHWDAAIQDDLAAFSESRANAYQLGRGLSESYWAMPAPDDQHRWDFLLGAERCGRLTRLLGRVAGYFNPLAAPAVAGSLQVWVQVAQRPEWRKDADEHLYAQVRRWYEVLVVGQDPQTLLRPYQFVRDFRLLWRTARRFWPQLLVGLVALGVIVGLAVGSVLGSGTSTGKTVVAILGFIGLSGASLQARLKNGAQSTLRRLQRDAYADYVAQALTVVPLLPLARSAEPKTQRMIRKTVQQRSLAVAIDAAV